MISMWRVIHFELQLRAVATPSLLSMTCSEELSLRRRFGPSHAVGNGRYLREVDDWCRRKGDVAIAVVAVAIEGNPGLKTPPIDG